jgi:hypothetical protein
VGPGAVEVSVIVSVSVAGTIAVVPVPVLSVVDLVTVQGADADEIKHEHALLIRLVAKLM